MRGCHKDQLENSMAGVLVCAPKRNENGKNLWKKSNPDGETNNICGSMSSLVRISSLSLRGSDQHLVFLLLESFSQPKP